jgi:hypothetical protein
MVKLRKGNSDSPKSRTTTGMIRCSAMALTSSKTASAIRNPPAAKIRSLRARSWSLRRINNVLGARTFVER